MSPSYRALWGVFAFVAAAFAGASARSAVIYSNTFEASAGSEWSATTRSTTPVGARHYLGQFNNKTVSLTLNSLPAHTSLRISFDVYVIQYWTGNGTYYGPHLWDFGISGSPSLLHTTFSNGDQPQAYPGNYPEVNNPPYTAVTEMNTLGYTPNPPGDAVYHMSYDIYHTAASVVFQFTGTHLQGLPTTNWGLDNVTVETISLPKPPPAHANVVVNGDFETPIVSTGNLVTYNAPSTGIPGWTLSNGSIDLNGEYWQNAGGRQSLDMNGLDYPGTIYQDVPTTPGKSYVISFSLAGNGGGSPVKYLEVWWGGTKVDTAVFDTTGTNYQNMGWVRKQYLVTTAANTATTTRLKFVSENTGSFGPALDLVSVVPAVPGDLLLDGEFEEPSVGAGHTVYSTYDMIDNWLVADGSVQQVGTEWQAAGVSQSMHLNVDGPGTISQDIATTPGQAYLVRFAMAGDPDGGPASKTMEVDWGGNALGQQTFDTTGRTRTAMGWSRRAYLVSTSSPTTTLAFRSLTAGAYGPVIDSVSVVPATPGDADQDGGVTVLDAIVALRQVTSSGPTEAGVAALSDVYPAAGTGGRLHGDGVVTLDDVRAILRMASGLAKAT